MKSEKINSHMPDKYCPVCGAIWIPHTIGDVPTCQCSRVPVGTIHYNPVSRIHLTVRPLITRMARKYMDCPFPSGE